MDALLKDKVAIVTGGGGRLGSATARGLAEAGAALVITEIDPESAQAVAASLAVLADRRWPCSRFWWMAAG